MVIEATLAQPGQHFITSYLDDRDLLPGFREGMENVAADEQRHIGFGVKLLSDLRKMDPEVPDAVADLLREVIPYTASVLIPPDWDMRYIECFGFTLEDIGEEGATSLETKMRSAGHADRRAARPAGVPRAGHRRASAPSAATRWCAPATSARRSGRPRRDPADMRLLFETIAGGLDSGAAAAPGVLQWDFRDAEPWHVVVANGDTARRAGPRRLPAGHAASPRSRTSWTSPPAGRTPASSCCADGCATAAISAGYGRAGRCSRPKDRRWSVALRPDVSRGLRPEA